MSSELHGQSPFITRSGMIEEDQGTAVGLVKTAVMDHWPQVSVLASGLDLVAKYCWFMLDYDSQGLLIDKLCYPRAFSMYMKALVESSAAGQFLLFKLLILNIYMCFTGARYR